ncbi:hypothetical protein COX69_02950 [Candidatus Falkowbacteria bacterium CG_4_10_14_0_2_um_filter_48_10]|uniref:SHSP domain-containing protein n=1 Tax=Candidatus Falkowbacteria bacterium CG23_combo_of_CG06-09_8_20_14_all_49_15 TaxID=1974572 RepID=A0A2G9ZLD6_9BACT|nr:MAG: hypothetical protein COX22_01490 [Candidatus Falkowbacteria bacterium CG23_combo_of_CG06-09_8_20_14_all_49_15]PJA08182.1 MAG: hypothetical protein COX69_02950 [Candidatus Falkowbacteria bacterium CG_4_10_14_0_2_um_filter_48_10]
MSSFLDKLKGKINEENLPAPEAAVETREKDKDALGYLQLDVDIFQTAEEIIIFALVPGVEINDLDITVENENDVITIQGTRKRPLDLEGEGGAKNLREELLWGQFYRQIVLPQEINVAEVAAKVNKGILTLRLPLLRLQTKGKKKISIQADSLK